MAKTKKPLSKIQIHIPVKEKKIKSDQGNLFLRGISLESRATFKEKAKEYGYSMNEFFDVIVKSL